LSRLALNWNLWISSSWVAGISVVNTTSAILLNFNLPYSVFFSLNSFRKHFIKFLSNYFTFIYFLQFIWPS
jgi:hypothetical protein